MNAARPTFSAFASASLLPDAAAPAAPKRRSRRARAQAQSQEPQPEGDEYAACLVQARICREQAQEAARLKRFKAAVGLFQTAISLCQRAVTLRKSPPLASLDSNAVASISSAQSTPGQDAPAAPANDGEAREYLQVLAVELSAYDELARSMNRPLIDSGR